MPEREGPGPSADVIVIGASVRALAQSARAGGWSVHAVDLFRDVDLREAAAHSELALAPYPAGFAAAAANWPSSPWCYTGAIENHPDLVDRLAATRPLAGNDGDRLRAVRDPQRLAQAVRGVGLAFPETLDSPAGAPVDGSFLLKPRSGAGGRGIARWRGRSPPPGAWIWQRMVAGAPSSAAFAIDASGARLVGSSRQLVGRAWCHARPFAWCGAVDVPPAVLPASVRRQLELLGATLAAEFGLGGVVGVDVVVDGDGMVHVLEVNPRPTASMELWERSSGASVAGLHLAAFGLRRPASPPPGRVAGGAWAKAVLFAAHALHVDGRLLARILEMRGEWSDDDGDWPAVADIPAAGTDLDAGAPALTVFANAPHAAAALVALRRRVRFVDALLRTGRVSPPDDGAAPPRPPPGSTA